MSSTTGKSGEGNLCILGIDPGLATTGWAVIKGNYNKQQLLDCGLITTSKTQDHGIRLEQIYDQVFKKIKELKPDVVAIEKLFFNTNAKTALLVGQTHGIVKLAAQKAKIPSIEYTPLQIKMTITGYGRADKKQIQFMIKNLLHLDKEIKQDDTADAIAIALCHCYNTGNYRQYNNRNL